MSTGAYPMVRLCIKTVAVLVIKLVAFLRPWVCLVEWEVFTAGDMISACGML